MMRTLTPANQPHQQHLQTSKTGRRARFVYAPEIPPTKFDENEDDKTDCFRVWGMFRDNLGDAVKGKDQFWFEFINNFEWIPGDNHSDVLHDIIRHNMVRIESSDAGDGEEIYYAPQGYTRLQDKEGHTLIEPFAVALQPVPGGNGRLLALALLFSSDDAVQQGRRDHDALVFRWIPGEEKMPYSTRREIGGLNSRIFAPA